MQAASRLYAATEVDAAQRYWHAATSTQIPRAYERPVVGMRWSTIAQFGTWFGGNPVFAYGIQLIPLTPYAEVRDSTAFSRALLPFYERDCDRLGGNQPVRPSWASTPSNRCSYGDRASEM